MDRIRLTSVTAIGTVGVSSIAFMTVACLARAPDLWANHAQPSTENRLLVTPIIEGVQAVQLSACGGENAVTQFGLDTYATISQVAVAPVANPYSGLWPGNDNPLMVAVTPVASATGDRRVAPTRSLNTRTFQGPFTLHDQVIVPFSDSGDCRSAEI